MLLAVFVYEKYVVRLECFFFLWEVCTVFFVTDLWWLGDFGKAKSVRRTKDAFSHD